MGYTYRAGKVQFQEKSSCFRELPSHCICWLQGWEMTGSQVRALKSTDEHPDRGHPRQAEQVPPVLVQMTPSTWEECEEELSKSLPKTAKEPKNQPEHSTVRLRLITSLRLSIHQEVRTDKPPPPGKKFQNVILE